MTRDVSVAAPRSAPASFRLGERLRQLRVSAGLTQTDLAGERFSKEYVSQIERGKTRPTRETIDWLSTRLGVDPSFLASGVSVDDRGRMETALTRAEALSEAREFEASILEFEQARVAVLGTGSPELEVRALVGEAWARMESGEMRAALELLDRARLLVEKPTFSDVDRADVLFRLGVCRWELSSISKAIALFDEALSLAERSDLPCDTLRSNILSFRARCYRRQRDWEAAREDVERALELAEGINDRKTVGQVYFQASLIAERNGHWLLARRYAEKAKAQYEDLSDRASVGRLLNNLGGLNFLLGNTEQAVEQFKQSFHVLLDTTTPAEAAEVVSSLAQLHLKTGDVELAEQQARQALEMIGDRPDLLLRIGNAQLVLGRALMEQGRLDEAELTFAEAEKTCEQVESASHRAAAWMARADLATKRGDDHTAARLYKRAAEALQDFRF